MRKKSIVSKSSSPLISVLMPVYNSEKYLAAAIESILNQTLKDFEFWIINDGSQDISYDIIENYAVRDKRIKTLHLQKNSGIAVALNKGLQKAKSKYIARMDADDISLLQRFAKQITFMEANPAIDMCGTAVQTFDEKKKGDVWQPPLRHKEILAHNVFTPSFSHPTVMIRSSVIKQHRIRYDESFVPAEDYELWIRMQNLCVMANIPEVLLEYRVSAESTSAKSFSKQRQISNQVQKKLLEEQLKIKLLRDETKLHSALSFGDDKIFFFENHVEAHKWINKITAANEKVAYVPQEIFMKEIEQRLHNIQGINAVSLAFFLQNFVPLCKKCKLLSLATFLDFVKIPRILDMSRRFLRAYLPVPFLFFKKSFKKYLSKN